MKAERGDQTPQKETRFPTNNLRPKDKLHQRAENDYFEKVKHEQYSAALSKAASMDLSSEAAKKEVQCNACLVSVVEITEALRKAYKESDRPLTKTEASSALNSACSDTGQVKNYGLLKDGGNILKAFSRDTQAEIMKKFGYDVVFYPTMSDILNTTCKFLVQEYEGDFMVLMSKDHQMLELQANLCGPSPGAHFCSSTTEDWTRRAQRHRRERMKMQQQKAASEAQFAASLEDIDDLKDVFDEL
mmetsp:Transcript_32260/g.44750  ORF Transcript_32260/g.44750 Transcript_32260/m.44750 type:complete len:245 (+) Transcript_32260:221-955(+)